MPAEATVWGYVLISIMPAAPELEPWMATDYKTEDVCEIDRKALEEVLPFRRAWCIPSPKPTKEYTGKRTREETMMLDDTTALNMALAKIAELEIEFERQTMQVAKLKHLIANVKKMDARMHELHAQRDDALARVEELERMLDALRPDRNTGGLGAVPGEPGVRADPEV